MSERIAAFELAWSLVLYLVQVYNMTMETATYILSVSSGITGLLPLVGGFVADTYLGRYRSILIGSFAYLLVKSNGFLLDESLRRINIVGHLVDHQTIPGLRFDDDNATL